MQLNNQGMQRYVETLDKDARALKKELLRIVWFMRGGVTYSEAHAMTFDERNQVGEQIEENLKITKESGLPFF